MYINSFSGQFQSSLIHTGKDLVNIRNKERTRMGRKLGKTDKGL